MNIRPLADRVLVEPKEAETKTASGKWVTPFSTESIPEPRSPLTARTI